jgi:Cu(I)/Ag(I) efflux system membrane fusion protein
MRGLLLGCVLVLAGCVGGEAASVAEAQSAPAAPAARAGSTQTPAQKLISAYLSVQKKLAADDAKGAKTAFAQLRSAAEAKELTGDAALKQKLVSAAVSGANAKDIDAARAAFGQSSDSLLDWLRREGNALGQSVRVAHCPMARDGKGARWVQTDAKVANPYFGSEMLECGSIEKEVKAGGKL